VKGSAAKTTRRRVRLLAAIAVGFAPARLFAGVPVQWDPDPTPGLQGGSGAWTTSFANWDDNGSRQPWFSGNGDTAVFAGDAGGVVQLIDVITAAGLQFDTPGYTLGSTPKPVLTLSGGSILANANATIVSSLSTAAGLTKSGQGVVTLLGNNTFRGTLTLSAGTLAFSALSQLGQSPNDLRLVGGGFRYAGGAPLTFPTNRAVIVDAPGGHIETTDGQLLLNTSGQITGTGILTKLGPQVLRIAAPNPSFDGSLNVAAGTVFLDDPAGINGRPVTLSGGTFWLRSDSPANFQSSVTVTASSALNVDQATPAGMSGGSHSVDNLTIAAGATLGIGGDHLNYLTANNLSLDGGVRFSDSALLLKGALTGPGVLAFGAATQAPESFLTGLLIANGNPNTLSNAVQTDDAVAARAVIGISVASTLTYNGTWNAAGASAQSSVVLRDGAKFVLGAPAHINTATRPFTAIGNGAAANIFEIDSAFLPVGMGSLQVRDCTLLTHAGASLPPLLTFSGTVGARWVIADADHHLAGALVFSSSAQVQTEKDLTQNGPLQIAAGATVTKTGPGSLTVAGAQSNAPGSAWSVQSGTLHFDSDPGGGVTITAGGPAAPRVEFAASLSRLEALQLTVGGDATLAPGECTLFTRSLVLFNGASLDISDGRLMVDYATGNSPLLAVLSMIKTNRLKGDAAAGTVLAAGEASDILQISGTQTASFAGQIVDATTVLVRSARPGDANFDGHVTFADFQRLELGYGSTGQGWGKGDFNGDGTVDDADFKLLYDNLEQPSLPLATSAAIPEPSLMIGCCGIGGFVLSGSLQNRPRHKKKVFDAVR
jgi:autotransporter-associated beta strand protein